MKRTQTLSLGQPMIL